MKNMDKVAPIVHTTPTQDGWITSADHGKDGISRSEVHILPGTPEEAARNRTELNRVLGRFGYKVTEITPFAECMPETT